jgi:hypothetical protein
VIANAGVGDVDEALEADNVGVVLRGFDNDSYVQCFESAVSLQKDSRLIDRCQRSVRARFDLERVGGVSYRRLYSRVLNNVGHIEVEVAA